MNFPRDDIKRGICLHAGGDAVFVLENWLRLRFMVMLCLHQLMLLKELGKSQYVYVHVHVRVCVLSLYLVIVINLQ